MPRGQYDRSRAKRGQRELNREPINNPPVPSSVVTALAKPVSTIILYGENRLIKENAKTKIISQLYDAMDTLKAW